MMEDIKKSDEIKDNEDTRETANRKQFLRGFLLGLVAMIAIITASTAIRKITRANAEPTEPASEATYNKIKVIDNLVDEHFIGDIDKSQMTDYLFYGMITGLDDKYSAYYTATDYEDVLKQSTGVYDGIGINIVKQPEDKYVRIDSVFEDSPAEKAGLLADDLIISINGLDMEDATTGDVVDIIGTDDDSVIDITILRTTDDGEKTYSFSITREKLTLTTVEYKMLEDEIGYILIESFADSSVGLFKDALSELQEQGMKAIIIDLRDNPGGVVSSCVDILSSFMPKGILVNTVDKDGKREDYTCDGENEISIPLAVLVNENSASASEIFAGAVMDYKAGKIIGTTTFGKGIVQETYEFNDGSAVKLTTSHYYTPNGNDIHGNGIEPDIIVEDEKQQLEKAVKVLKEEM